MKPAFTLTLPGGFIVRALSKDEFYVSGGAETNASGFAIVRVFQPGVVDSIADSPQVKADATVAETVAGIAGHSIEVEVAPSAGQYATLFDTAETQVTYGLPAGSRMHLVELAVGQSTVIVEYDATSDQFQAHASVARAILASLKFAS